MPLYELVCIATHSLKFTPIQTLTTITTNLILANGGLVRTLDFHGQRTLPQKMKRGDEGSAVGDYFTLRFDANPPTVAALNERLRLDPRVLRWSTLKIGSTLASVTAPNNDPTMKFSRFSEAEYSELESPPIRLDATMRGNKSPTSAI